MCTIVHELQRVALSPHLGAPIWTINENWPRTQKISTTTTQTAKKENLQRAILAPSTPTVDMDMLAKTSKTISTIAILRPVKAIFEKRAAAVEVALFLKLVKICSKSAKNRQTRPKSHKMG